MKDKNTPNHKLRLGSGQEQLAELEKKIKELDVKVEAIQKSTATNINSLIHLHNQLRMKSKFYYKWHLNPKASLIHLVVLVLYIITITISSIYFAVSPYKLTKAAGATYYVAKTGKDSNTGTESQPWLTIQKAADTMVAGDTVYVKEGTYSERVTETTPGTASNRIIYENYGTDTVVVTDGFHIDGNYITVDGFEITPGNNVPDGTYYGVIQIDGDYNLIKNCNIHDTTHGDNGIVYNGDYSLVENCIVYNFEKIGIHFQDGASFNTARGSSVIIAPEHHSGRDINYGFNGMMVGDDSNNNLIENNNIQGPYNGGNIKLPAFHSGTTIRGNKIWRNLRRDGSSNHLAAIANYGGASDLTIEGNVIGSHIEYLEGFENIDPSQSHVWFGGISVSYTNVKIYNNVLLSKYGGAYSIQGRSTVSIDGLYMYNNILWTRSGVYLGGPVSNDFYKNNIYRDGGSSGSGPADYNIYWNVSVPSGESSHSFQADPLFVNPDVSAATNYGVNANWHLQASSPAIDKGINDANTPSTDKDGNPRVGAVDIGAYEYQGAGKVYYVAKTGNDANPGTESQPWLTMQKAANTAKAGDTVYVKAGTYDEWIVASKAGTASSPVIFDNYQNNNVKVTRGIRIDGSYITFKDFELTDGSNAPSGAKGTIELFGHHNTIDHFNIHDTANYIWYDPSSDYNTVQNSTVLRVGGSDTFNVGGKHPIIKNNYISQKGFTGNWNTEQRYAITIGTWDFVLDGAWVEGNTVEGPLPGGANGIHIPAPIKNATFKNNIITNIALPEDTDWHTQTIGVYSHSENLVFEGNILGSDQAPPGFVLGFTHIYLGGDNSNEHHINTVFKNNIILGFDGSYWFHTDSRAVEQNGVYIYNNVIHTRGGMRILGGAKNVYCKNNIVMSGSSLDGNRDYNLYANAAEKPSDEPHSITGNPQFVNPDTSAATNYGVNANWHLQAGSPAINKGILDANTPTTDKDGNPRVGAVDIGAYEYQGGGGDTTPPAVSITSPSNGATVSGNVTILANASDNVAVSKVEFYVDSNLVSTDTTSPYSYSWNSTTVSNSSHTIKAKAYDTSSLTSEASITVSVLNIGIVSPTLSTVTVNPSSLVVNNTSTITITLKDGSGNPVSGKNVSISSTGSSNTITQPSSATNSSGVATGSIKSTKAEKKTITIVDTTDSITLTSKPTVTFNPGPTSQSISTASVSPSSLQTGGTSIITITLKDNYSNLISGHFVTLSSNRAGDIITQPTSATNVSGQTTGSVSSAIAGTSTIIVYDNTQKVTLNSTPQVTFQTIPPPPEGTNIASASNGGQVASYSHQEPNGPASALIDGQIVHNADDKTWMVTDPTGTEYAIIKFNNTYSINQINHYNDGQYGAKSVTVKYSLDGTNWNTLGTWNDLTTTASTPNQDTFTFDPVQAQYVRLEYTSFNDSSWLQVNEIEIYLGDASPSDTTPPSVSITSPSSGATVSGNVTISANASDNVAVSKVEFYIDSNLVSTDTTSPYSYSWNSTTVSNGSHTIKAKAYDTSSLTSEASITVSVLNIGIVSPSLSTVTVSPSSLVVNNTSTITITLKDGSGNPVSGKNVSISSTGSSNTITQPSSATNSSGVATGSIKSTKAEKKTITIIDTTDSITLTSKPTITFNPGPTSQSISTASVSPSSLQTGGTSIITITLKDNYSNLISGHFVTLSSNRAGDIITQPISATNASGQTTGSISSAIAGTSTITVYDSTQKVTLNQKPQIIFTTLPHIPKITEVKNEGGDYNFYAYKSPEGSQACNIQDSDLWNIPSGNNTKALAYIDSNKIGVIKRNTNGDEDFFLYNAPEGQQAASQIGADYWNIPSGNNVISIAGLDSDSDGQDELAVLKNERSPDGRIDQNVYIYELPSGSQAKSIIAKDLWNIPSGNNAISICGVNIADSGADKIAVIKNEKGDHNLYIYNAPVADQACNKIASDLWNIPSGNNVISIAGVDYSGNRRKDKIAVLKNEGGDYNLYVYNLPSSLLTPSLLYGQDLWNIPSGNNIVDLGG